MSKMKEKMAKDHEHEMELYYSFMEFVCDQKNEVSKSDVTKEAEEGTEVSSTTGTSIVPTNTLKAANNPNYNPNRSMI